MNFKKRLIFHFYVDKDYSTNRAVAIHLKCLKYYSNVFDEALFCIALNDTSDNDAISAIEAEICSCGFKDVRFKVVENDAHREATTFYYEIATKLKELDGITFFGHTKGYTNYNPLPSYARNEDLDTWITGLYYLSLNDMECVEKYLDSNNFYGSFLTYVEMSKENTEKNFIIYSGAFFWLNAHGLIKYSNKIPQDLVINYAENFPSQFYTYEDFLTNAENSLGSPNFYISFVPNLYYFANLMVPEFLKDKYQNFLEYKKNIINKI